MRIAGRPHFVRTSLVVGVASFAIFAGSASAKTVRTSEGHLLCSVGDGQFEDVEIDHWKQSWALSGRLRFVEGNPESEWPSAGGIVFGFEQEKDGNVGAFVMQSKSRPDMLDIIIKLPGVGRSEWLSEVPRDSWVSLTVYLDEESNLTVSDGKAIRTIALKNPKVIKRLIHCQSGTFEFDVSSVAQPNLNPSN